MKAKTYCNPLSIADIKSGRSIDASLTRANEADQVDYRSISDPSVVYHDGKWIMYPSYSIAYVTEDFVHWKHVDIGIPHLRYSPAVVQFRGKWYLNGHGMPEVYSSDSPLGPFKLCGYLTDVHGNQVHYGDGCFLADGDRLYFYCFGTIKEGANPNVERDTGTLGVEMDPEKPWQMLSEMVWINRFDPDVQWQRTGENHQNVRMGWIEGQWMKKIGNRYYLMYSGSGTQYSTYVTGIAYSDEGPLSGFRMQKNHDPFTYKRHGLMRGAGHGCLVEGPNQTLWVFYTCRFGFHHIFERRIGMDPVGIDENGELYCPEVTDVPQFAPGVLEAPQKGNGCGWLPLTFMQPAVASSCLPGREAIYAVDDSVLSWWQPTEEDPLPTLTVTLGKNTAYRVQSCRLIWNDVGMETAKGVMPGPFRYTIEYAPAPDQQQWRVVVDARENREDLCIDYREFSPVEAYGIRLRIYGWPEGIRPGLISLTAFGNAVV